MEDVENVEEDDFLSRFRQVREEEFVDGVGAWGLLRCATVLKEDRLKLLEGGEDIHR